MKIRKKGGLKLGWLVGVLGVLAVAAGLAFLLAPRDDGDSILGDILQRQAEPDAVLTRGEEILEGMTLEEKIGQMFVVDTAGLEYGVRGNIDGINNYVDNALAINEAQKRNLAKYGAGGVVFFGGNIKNAEQVKSYTLSLQSASKYGLVMATDQEGGIVDRLRLAGVTRFGNMATIGATGDTNNAYNVGATYGREMKALGFNVDFAPVADVNTNPKNPVIGVRAFGSDVNLVAGMVAAEVKGLQENGVAATLKHFPGHGDTATDSHTGLPVVGNDLTRLREVELVPFKAGIEAGAGLVLTAHIKIPKVDPSGLPATMSKVILTDILRKEMNFEGVVITDALGMAAIAGNYSTEQIVTNCVGAGVDMLLMPVKFFEMYDVFLGLVRDGKIAEERVDESVLRIINLKLKLGAIK